ncbi:hypothetical protein MtrunA17_Chr4g0024581 [Medicago truncatula]|uniref:Uncharacterized protein n=1 Tax=Medicago truncatula TaxID=3880 RepID=A0A396IBX7_MEDTR|nr:hypothetical protein MtrunA17_Chr4g0024581 [Medicago truncatula]
MSNFVQVHDLDEDDAGIVRRYFHLLPETTFEDDDELSKLLHIITSNDFIKEMSWEKEVTVSLKNSKNVLHIP